MSPECPDANDYIMSHRDYDYSAMGRQAKDLKEAHSSSSYENVEAVLA